MAILEKKFPPLLVFAIFGFFMWAAARQMSQFDFSLGVFTSALLFGLFIFIGSLMVLLALLDFRKAQTTFNPVKPEEASHLVTDGVYRATRNPMYLSLFTWLLAWGIFLSNSAAIAISPLFLIYIHCFQIRPEEKALQDKFGDAFDAYKKQTRRWI